MVVASQPSAQASAGAGAPQDSMSLPPMKDTLAPIAPAVAETQMPCRTSCHALPPLLETSW